MLRYLAIAAILLCIIVMSTEPAFGYANIFQMTGQWTAEQFSFAGISAGTNDNVESDNQAEKKYTSLQEALNQYGITDAVVPQSLPDGFQPEEIWVQEYPGLGNIEFSAPY